MGCNDWRLWYVPKMTHTINNSLVLFQLYLTTLSYSIFALTSLVGVTQIPMMLNPLFESTSISDFWGRRWKWVVSFDRTVLACLLHWFLTNNHMYIWNRNKASLFMASSSVVFTNLFVQSFAQKWLPQQVHSLLQDCFMSGYWVSCSIKIMIVMEIAFHRRVSDLAMVEILYSLCGTLC